MIPLQFLKAGCTLSWDGIHGIKHWQRVNDNGMRLAATTGANITIVELFAFLHDLKRLNDGRDPDHGLRAAEFIGTIHGKLFSLPQDDLDLLCFACEFHSSGLTEADVTVQTCWDADRLDLGRVGIQIEDIYLSTAAAKTPRIKKWAYARSIREL